MVEQTSASQPSPWNANLLSHIVQFLSPEESIKQLKLWAVNKDFQKACKHAASI